MAFLRMRKLYNSLVPVNAVDQNVLQLAAEMNEELYVEIKELSKSDLRKAAQNSLYWGWITCLEKTDINEHAGRTKDEWHFQFKKDFLLRIYERDDLGYAATVQTLRELYKKGGKTESLVLLDWIVKMQVSTRNAKIKQFTEYLNEIERFCHSIGVILMTDSITYSEAMGIKSNKNKV